jgi:hypothetical protein
MVEPGKEAFKIVVKGSADAADQQLLENISESETSKKPMSIDEKIDDVFKQLIPSFAQKKEDKASPVRIIGDLGIVEEPKIPKDRAGDIEALKLLSGNLAVNNSILECALSVVMVAFIDTLKRKPNTRTQDVDDLNELLKHMRSHDKLAVLQQYDIMATRLMERGGDPDMNAILYLVSLLYCGDIMAF